MKLKRTGRIFLFVAASGLLAGEEVSANAINVSCVRVDSNTVEFTATYTGQNSLTNLNWDFSAVSSTYVSDRLAGDPYFQEGDKDWEFASRGDADFSFRPGTAPGDYLTDGQSIQIRADLQPGYVLVSNAATCVAGTVSAGPAEASICAPVYPEVPLTLLRNGPTRLQAQGLLSGMQLAVEHSTNLLLGEFSWQGYTNVIATNGVMTIPVDDTEEFKHFRMWISGNAGGGAESNNPPAGMNLIPAGSFVMGNTFPNEGYAVEFPLHTVTVSAVYMDTYEVSNENMREVLQYAYDNGLVAATAGGVTNLQGAPRPLLYLEDEHCQISFLNGVFSVDPGKTNFPCVEVSWFGAQAYCNYKSDMEGLTRCIDFTDWSCDFTRNGYRLPTEAEWEKAARGGVAGLRYPWGDVLLSSDANFLLSGDPYDAFGPEDLNKVLTTPVGYYPANGYGVYDMAGNVYEWCYDWYQGNWYSDPAASAADTTGPAGPLTYRIKRGGSCEDFGPDFEDNVVLRCAFRRSDFINTDRKADGFRAARGL